MGCIDAVFRSVETGRWVAPSDISPVSSIQVQALSAVLFLYKQVLCLDIGPIEHVPRARMPDKLPVVLSREDIRQLMKHVEGTMWLHVMSCGALGVKSPMDRL